MAFGVFLGEAWGEEGLLGEVVEGGGFLGELFGGEETSAPARRALAKA